MKLLKLGYRVCEVPVSKVYPPRAVGNTKMRPLVDWWNMLAPILFVGLGLERLTRAGWKRRRSPSGETRRAVAGGVCDRDSA